MSPLLDKAIDGTLWTRSTGLAMRQTLMYNIFFVSNQGWNNVFFMLIAADVLAAIVSKRNLIFFHLSIFNFTILPCYAQLACMPSLKIVEKWQIRMW